MSSENYWLSGQLLKAKSYMYIVNSDGSNSSHDEGEYFMLVSNRVFDQLDPNRTFSLLSQKTSKTSKWTETSVINNFNIFT